MKPIWIAALVAAAIGVAGGGYLVTRPRPQTAQTVILPCGDPLRELDPDRGEDTADATEVAWCSQGHRFKKIEGAWVPAPGTGARFNDPTGLAPWVRRSMGIPVPLTPDWMQRAPTQTTPYAGQPIPASPHK